MQERPTCYYLGITNEKINSLKIFASKCEIIKLLKDNIGEKLGDLEYCSNCLDTNKGTISERNN